MQDNEKIIVAMSGGVDSSVSVRLLLDAGYQVEGIHMLLWKPGLGNGPLPYRPMEIFGVEDPERLFGIKVHPLQLHDQFRDRIVGNFMDEYASGRTPNPCVECNRLIKFGALLDAARSLGGTALATGHYARVRQLPNGRYAIFEGADRSKNQSYYLYGLSQAALKAIRFPLGEYTKPQVRELARNWGIPAAEKAESQEICFIPDDDYRHFLKDMGMEFTPGRFIDQSGVVLGSHDGKEKFTIGQRRGLGIAHSQPLYVVEIQPEGDIVVGEREACYSEAFTIQQVNLQALSTEQFIDQHRHTPLEVMTQIRYRSAPVPTRIRFLEQSDATGWNHNPAGVRAVVESEQPLSSVTPGQSAVFYGSDDNGQRYIIGGGLIERSLD